MDRLDRVLAICVGVVAGMGEGCISHAERMVHSQYAGAVSDLMQALYAQQ